MMLPRLTFSHSTPDYVQTLSYPGNEFRLPVLNEPKRGLPVSGVYALEMERSGYLELQRYINGKSYDSSFKVSNMFF